MNAVIGSPKGKYKVEVLMLNEGGEQKDQTARKSGHGGTSLRRRLSG